MAEYQTVFTSDLEIDRLDADFYRPHYVANQRLLRTTTVGKLRRLSDIAKRMACGPFGSELPSSLYRSQGIPLFRVQNVRDGYITEDGLVFLDKVTSESMNSCAFTGGNLLLAKSGLLGRIASVPLTIDRCNVTQDVIGIAIDDSKADAHYVLAFLTAEIGRLQVIRWGQGNVQQHLNMPSVRRFEWIEIGNQAQQYIGDKMRQAERLRQISRKGSAYALRMVNAFLADEKSAMNLEHEVSKLLDGEVLTDEHFQQIESKGPRQPNQGRKSSRIPKVFLTTRLDCNFYNRDALELDMRFAKGYEVAILGDIVDPSRQITNGVRGPDIQPTMFKLVRLQDFAAWSIDFDHCLTISAAQFRENRRCQLQEGDVVVAIGGYIGCAAMARRVQTAVIGQHSAVLPMGTNSKVDEGFLVAFLSSNAGAIQLQRYVSGTVQVGVNLEDLRQIRLPLPSSMLQKHIGDAVRQADDCSHWASRLLNLACRLVEALIEGRIAENELCEAYVALNAGDHQADNSILGRMTVGGLDVPHEPPLFPDLDGLYAAIDEAERTHTDGETS
jgi:type I restriction enzyme, S subunit